MVTGALADEVVKSMSYAFLQWVMLFEDFGIRSVGRMAGPSALVEFLMGRVLDAVAHLDDLRV